MVFDSPLESQFAGAIERTGFYRDAKGCVPETLSFMEKAS